MCVFFLTDESNSIDTNGTLTGLMGHINRTEIDIGVQSFTMSVISTETEDFSYFYKLYYGTFMTEKPQYEPQILGILQTFSLSLRISIITVMITVIVVYFFIWKWKYALDKIFLIVFAVFLRQNSILRPSSKAENLLIFSWVVGAMFLCLAYDSVFLSFLAFPPVSTMKDLSELASAVEERKYHCVTNYSQFRYSRVTVGNKTRTFKNNWNEH